MEYCRLDGDTGRLRTEIKHPRLLLFNPGHEMVPEIIGKKPYVPPPVVRSMMRDLGLLPAWLTKSEQDFVFCPEKTLPIPTRIRSSLKPGCCKSPTLPFP